MSGLLGIAALVATLMWSNSLAFHVAQGAGVNDVLLETACLAMVLTALVVVAAQLWNRLVRGTDQALALLPDELERASGDELGRLTQALGRLAAARTGHIADEAARQRRLSAEITRRSKS